MPPKNKEQIKQKKKTRPRRQGGSVWNPYEAGPEDFSVSVPRRPLTAKQLFDAEVMARRMQEPVAMAMDTPGVPADTVSAAINEARSMRRPARPAASAASSAGSAPAAAAPAAAAPERPPPSGEEAIRGFGGATTSLRRQTRRVQEDLYERSDESRKESGPAAMDFSAASRGGTRNVRRPRRNVDIPTPAPAPAPAPAPEPAQAPAPAAGPAAPEETRESDDMDAAIDVSLEEVLQAAEDAPVLDAADPDLEEEDEQLLGAENETVAAQTDGGGFVADTPADLAVLGTDLTWGPAAGKKRARDIRFKSTDYFISGTDISAPAEKYRRRPKPGPNRPSLARLTEVYARARDSKRGIPEPTPVSNVEARAADRQKHRKEARMAKLYASRTAGMKQTRQKGFKVGKVRVSG